MISTSRVRNTVVRWLLIFAALATAIIVPRYYGHLQYDAMEDEILAIGNNVSFTPQQLLFAPDYTHPGLWYILMDIPADYLGVTHGIFYHRAIQVLIITVGVCFIVWYFSKKLPWSFLLSVITLFLSNVAIIHITFQYRMYSLVLCIAMFYSLYWFLILKENRQASFKECIGLALLADVAFLTNYSSIWLLPIWPVAYLLWHKNTEAIKKLTTFTAVFLLAISWFIPIFFHNTRLSVELNQWASPLNLRNVLELIGTYLGLIPYYYHFYRLNFFVLPLCAVLLASLWWHGAQPHHKLLRVIGISTTIIFSLFLVVVYITGDSLLYIRTSVPLALALYMLIATVYISAKKPSFFLVFLVVFLQLTQFLIYFSPHKPISKEYYLFNYHIHPMSYFKPFNFPPNSCLIPIPHWNTLALSFYLGSKVHQVPINTMTPEQIQQNLRNCSIVFLLDQNSLDRAAVQDQYDALAAAGYSLEFFENHENLDMYVVSPTETPDTLMDTEQ
jgi:hypothetical protein